MRSAEDIERLRDEYASLIQLERRSKLIKITPLDVSPGLPPNKYIVTYTCRGIEGVTEDQEPVVRDSHEVEIYLDHKFPTSEPSLTWLTPIWHPNIEHDPPHTVCTDNIKSWYPTRSLDQLVIALGEMIQYRKYHAIWEEPYPIDHEVAKWVLEYGEKNGIIGKTKPFDKRPLLRKIVDPPYSRKKKSRVVLVDKSPAPKRRVTLKFGNN